MGGRVDPGERAGVTVTRDDLRRIVDAAPCRKCGLPIEYQVHHPSSIAPRRCVFRIDRDALVDALATAFGIPEPVVLVKKQTVL